MTEVTDFFPVSDKFPEPYPSQESVGRAVREAFEDSRFVILESPVGSGKSAIAVMLARYYGGAHILIPRKVLQDQYHADFSGYLRTMKGKSAYPCLEKTQASAVDIQAAQESNGYFPDFPWNESCASYSSGSSSPSDAYDEGSADEDKQEASSTSSSTRRCPCDAPDGTQLCPYKIALGYAQEEPVVAHNFWSFIYQTSFIPWHVPKPLLVVDEAHMMEDIIRGFATKSVALPELVDDKFLPETQDREEWVEFLSNPAFVPKGKDSADRYLLSLEAWREKGPDAFVVDVEHREDIQSTKISFVPEDVGGFANRLIFSYGTKVLLMSGTIFDKTKFCRYLGISKEDAKYIKASSTFPKQVRPVYIKDKYQVDTSHKCWEDNLPALGDIIGEVAAVFNDAKGLIHVPSYKAMREVIDECDNYRLMGHTPEDFLSKLEEFYESNEPRIFVSPTCQQGVDFKGDRARFQIITRVPYLNAGDPFIKFKLKKDFAWYNYQALLTFGQMLGRINRGSDDFGATVLVDSRFDRFISKNQRLIPKWQREAFIKS